MAKKSAKADIQWTDTWYEEKFEPWSREVRPLLQDRQMGAAFKTYPFVAFEETPWTPWKIPLSQASVSVVTTAGLYRPGIDPPFEDTPEGDADPRIIELPRDVDLQTLATAHQHIPHDLLDSDVNVVLPLDLLKAMVQEGRIADLAPRVYSLVGYRARADQVASETAPAIAAAMEEDGVTLALLVPV